MVTAKETEALVRGLAGPSLSGAVDVVARFGRDPRGRRGCVTCRSADVAHAVVAALAGPPAEAFEGGEEVAAAAAPLLRESSAAAPTSARGG